MLMMIGCWDSKYCIQCCAMCPSELSYTEYPEVIASRSLNRYAMFRFKTSGQPSGVSQTDSYRPSAYSMLRTERSAH